MNTQELFFPTTNLEQPQVVERFLAEVLPPLPKLHRCLANEVNYLSTTISRVMLQRFGFRVEKDELIRSLRKMGYVFFVKIETNRRPPVQALTPLELSIFIKAGELHGEDIGIQDEEVFVYVNVNGKVVRALRCMTIPTPQNMSADKLALQKTVNEKVETFVHNVSVSTEQSTANKS